MIDTILDIFIGVVFTWWIMMIIMIISSIIV